MSDRTLYITVAVVLCVIYLLVFKFPSYVRDTQVEWNTLLDSGWPEEVVYQDTTTPTIVRRVVLGHKTQIGIDRNDHMRVRKVGVKIPLSSEMIKADETQSIRLE